jgi:farnesyl-diphosphate farnesyltransferase
MSGAANIEIRSGKDRADENFPVGSWLIAPHLRRHVHVFYTFARTADDIADSDELSAEAKVTRLYTMEAVLLGRTWRSAQGSADAGAPSAAALRDSLAETGVTPRHALELLVAFRQDATKSRYADWEELLAYCRLSAMPVGRHVLDLHGEAENTHESSDALCAALQVLNHLQDCAADLARLDRCYLPADLLRRLGARVGDLRSKSASRGLRRVLDALLDLVDDLNAEAAELPRLVRDRRLRLETAAICGLARRLAARLRAGDPVATRVKLRRTDVAASVLGSLRYLP